MNLSRKVITISISIIIFIILVVNPFTLYTIFALTASLKLAFIDDPKCNFQSITEAEIRDTNFNLSGAASEYKIVVDTSVKITGLSSESGGGCYFVKDVPIKILKNNNPIAVDRYKLYSADQLIDFNHAISHTVSGYKLEKFSNVYLIHQTKGITDLANTQSNESVALIDKGYLPIISIDKGNTWHILNLDSEEARDKYLGRYDALFRIVTNIDKISDDEIMVTFKNTNITDPKVLKYNFKYNQGTWEIILK